MAFIEAFGWTLAVILGITFFGSLIIVSKKPKSLTMKVEEQNQD